MVNQTDVLLLEGEARYLVSLTKENREARIRAQLREEKRRLDNIYNLIEEGIVKEGNINQRIEERLSNVSLLEAELTRATTLKKLPVLSHLLTTAFLQETQRKMKELFYQDSRFAKRYLKLFLDRILVSGDKVTLVARPDILFRAISLNTRSNLKTVPTAGVEWLPGLDDVDNKSRCPGNSMDWLRTVDNVRTILQQQTKYIYIPELSPQT